MCGIAGLADLRSGGALAADVEARGRAMADGMRHRGPDASGVRVADRRVALVSTRLAIIDPTPGANQPLATEDGSLWITLNGEIYDHEAIRARLEAKGRKFRTRSDTEAVLQLYAEEGEAMFAQLRGMYAFALYDAKRGVLLLARDPFGVKPLYYARALDGSLAWASELRALVAGGLEPRLDRDAARAFLAWGHVPGPATILQGVRELPPGWYLRVTRAGIEEREHRAPLAARPRVAGGGPSRAAVLRALDESVKAHLVSDVPVGLFLSGGVDSAAIAASLARLDRRDVRAFTVGMDDDALDETRAATDIAAATGLPHAVRRVTGADAARELPRMLRAMDQPTIDGLNTFLVAEQYAATGGRCALSGLGGDELFLAYAHTRALARARPLLRAAAATRVGPLAARALGRERRHGSVATRAAKALATDGEPACLYQAARRVLDDATLRDVAGGGTLLAPKPPRAGAPRGAAVAAMESTNYLPDQLLRDADVMSMAHSVELRVPFVDEPFANVVSRLPTSALLSGTPKRLLRATLPEDVRAIVDAPKRGFTLPLASWMHGPLAGAVDRGFVAVAESGLARRDALDALRAGFERGTRPWSHAWAPAVLGLWLQEAKFA